MSYGGVPVTFVNIVLARHLSEHCPRAAMTQVRAVEAMTEQWMTEFQNILVERKFKDQVGATAASTAKSLLPTFS